MQCWSLGLVPIHASLFAGSRGTPPRLPVVVSGQQLAEQDGDAPNGSDTRLQLPGGRSYLHTGSLPSNIAGLPGGRRWSVDAADGSDSQADAVRRGARLRCAYPPRVWLGRVRGGYIGS